MTGKARGGIRWMIALLLAFALIGAGATKLIGAEMQIRNLQSWGYPLWMRFPIGLGEIALALGLLLPALQRIAAIAMFPWAFIAIYTHLQSTPPQYGGIGAPILFAILAALMIWGSGNAEAAT